MKKTSASANGTSFFGSTISATPAEMKEVLGEPSFDFYDGKINFEWVLENENGDVFTVYDWKEGRYISDSTVIEWHIGGYNAEVTNAASDELDFALCRNQLFKMNDA